MSDQVIRPPKIGELHHFRGGEERRTAMVLSLIPADSCADSLGRLYEIAVAAAATDPDAEKKRADGLAVGLKVSFVVDPRDVCAFIEGRRSDLKTWMLPEDPEGL